MNKRKKWAEGTRARSSSSASKPTTGRPSKAALPRTRVQTCQRGPVGSARERGRGLRHADVVTTQAAGRRNSGEAIPRHSTPKRDSSRLRLYFDTGYLKLAVPLPGDHRNYAGDELYGGGNKNTSDYTNRKRGRGKRHGTKRTLTLDATAGSTMTEVA